MIQNLKMWGLKQKRRKLVNGLNWLMESDPTNPKITEMTDDLQKVNLQIDELENELNNEKEQY